MVTRGGPLLVKPTTQRVEFATRDLRPPAVATLA